MATEISMLTASRDAAVTSGNLQVWVCDPTVKLLTIMAASACLSKHRRVPQTSWKVHLSHIQLSLWQRHQLVQISQKCVSITVWICSQDNQFVPRLRVVETLRRVGMENVWLQTKIKMKVCNWELRSERSHVKATGHQTSGACSGKWVKSKPVSYIGFCPPFPSLHPSFFSVSRFRQTSNKHLQFQINKLQRLPVLNRNTALLWCPYCLDDGRKAVLMVCLSCGADEHCDWSKNKKNLICSLLISAVSAEPTHTHTHI